MSINALNNASQNFSTIKTPQISPIPGKDQVKNNAGGYVYALDTWKKLDRFLILGTEGGTYYCGEREITDLNTKNLMNCLKEDPERTIARVIEVSEQALAPKNEYAIFAIAFACAHGSALAKKLAYDAITRVCRTGTHLFQFCEYVTKMRGWSRGLRKGVNKFYLVPETEKVAYQVMKYKSREKWNHYDVLNLTHPKAEDEKRNALFKHIIGAEVAVTELPQIVQDCFELNRLVATKQIPQACKLIEDKNLPREVVPTELLNDANAWKSLLKRMPYTALIRNLGKMTSLGIFRDNLQVETKDVVNKITNEEEIKKSRIHPLQLLLAYQTYGQGHGFRGSLSWSPVPNIVSALEKAFYASFKYVEPTGKNFLLGVDVSGSMGSPINNTNISSAMFAGVMAMVIARTEQNHSIRGFAGTFKDLKIQKEDTIKTVMRKVHDSNFGTTDCSLPVLWALQNNLYVDCFVVITDNETYAGRIHPSQALKKYRSSINPNAKMIVIGTTATDFTIADPNDPYSLDVAGFDASIPQLVADFARE